MRPTRQSLTMRFVIPKRNMVGRNVAADLMFFVISIPFCYVLPCFATGCHTLTFKIATAAMRPRNDTKLRRFLLATQGFWRATDAAYPLRVLRNLRPSCCGSQNLCAALTAASNFDRCHSFLLAASATGGARKRPRTRVRRRVQVACLPNIFAVCQRVKKGFLTR